MDNKVTLTFAGSMNSLAGFEFGRQVYFVQVDNKLDYNSEFCIKFPNTIKYIAPSFAQGFFSEIIKKIGLYNLMNRINIECDNERIPQKVMHQIKTLLEEE